jgi:large subunit ribosomal protein L17
MRHRVKGRKLSRTAAHRDATLSSLAQALFMEDRIVTTVAKAKELRPYAEKLITRARQGDLHSRREALKQLKQRQVVDRLFHDVAPSFEGRPGGYTRIVKLGYRKSDAAELALIELVGRGMQDEGGKSSRAKSTKKAGTKKTTGRSRAKAKAPASTEPDVEAAAVVPDGADESTVETKAETKAKKPVAAEAEPEKKEEKGKKSRRGGLLRRRGKKGEDAADAE